MSGSRSRGARAAAVRPLLPLLDRLLEETPEPGLEGALSPAAALEQLRRSVRRDVEALLNARRRWRSWPNTLPELAVSPLNYGLPDCAGARFHGDPDREALRREIEDTIRRFEPRFRRCGSRPSAPADKLNTVLRLRIEALLQAEPAPEPIAFDTLIDAATADAIVRDRES